MKFQEQEVKKIESLLTTIFIKNARLQVISENGELADQENIEEKWPPGTIYCGPISVTKPYGYGHHRINVSENVQNSQACIFMDMPKMSLTQVLVICEILNKFIFAKIRDQGLAYAVTVQVDYKADEIAILVHDSVLILNALSAIRDAVQDLNQFILNEKMLERAKRSVYLKQMQRCQNSYDKYINEFIETTYHRVFDKNVLKNISVQSVIVDLNQFSGQYLNNSNLNIIVMMPKSTAMQKMSTLKAFVTYGFKLFM